MSEGHALPPERLPTLTEVIELSQTQTETQTETQRQTQTAYGCDPPPVTERRIAAAPVAVERRVAASPPVRSVFAEDAIIQRVLEDLHRQIDLMLEYRLREALAPVLARAADNMVRETRTELASTLRDVVSRAVSQEMARHRARESGRG